MRKSEMFTTILDVVARETEVSSACILSTCQREEVVDARHILCHFLLKHGFSTATTARMVKCSVRNVEKIRHKFDSRKEGGGKSFQFLYERIAKILRNTFERID